MSLTDWKLGSALSPILEPVWDYLYLY